VTKRLPDAHYPVKRASLGLRQAPPAAADSGCAFGKGGQVKKQRRRWEPSSEQLATLVDCSVARLPLVKAAELIGVGPRTLRGFSRRHGMPFPAPALKVRAPETGSTP
jgi:hypothetical protein